MGCTTGSTAKQTKEKKLFSDNNQQLIELLGPQLYKHIYTEMEVLVRAKILELFDLQDVEEKDIQKAKKTIIDEYDIISKKYKESQMKQLKEETFKKLESEQIKIDSNSENEIKIFNLVFKQDYLKDLINGVNKVYFDSFFSYIYQSSLQDEIFTFCENQLSKEGIQVGQIDDHDVLKQRLFIESKSMFEKKVNDYLKDKADCVNIKQLLLMKFSNNKREEIHPLSQLVKKSKFFVDQEGFISKLQFELAQREYKKKSQYEQSQKIQQEVSHQEKYNSNIYNEETQKKLDALPSYIKKEFYQPHNKNLQLQQQISNQSNQIVSGEESATNSKDINVLKLQQQGNGYNSNQDQMNGGFQSFSRVVIETNPQLSDFQQQFLQRQNDVSYPDQQKQSQIQTEYASVSQCVVQLQGGYGTGQQKSQIQTDYESVSQCAAQIQSRYGPGQQNHTDSTLVVDMKGVQVPGMSSINPGQSYLGNNDYSSISQIASGMKQDFQQLPSYLANVPNPMNSKITEVEGEDEDLNSQKDQKNSSNATGNFRTTLQSEQMNGQNNLKRNAYTMQNGLTTIYQSQITFGNVKSEIKYAPNSTKIISTLNQGAKTQKEIYQETMNNIYVNIDNKDVPINQLKNDQKVSELMKSPEFEQQFEKFFQEAIDKDPNNKDLQQLKANEQTQFQESSSKVLDFLGSAIH